MQVAWYSDFAAWLWGVITYIPRWLFGVFSDWILALWGWIVGLLDGPVNAWHATIGPVMAGSVGYWADVTQVGVGIGMIFSAYIVRFLIRRIPGVG